MQRYNNTVVNPTGQAIAGANIVVTVAAQPPGSGAAATLFGDDGLTPISNTVVADNLGRFGFFAPDGKYDLTVSGGQPLVSSPYVLAAVEILDLLEFNQLDAQPITVQTLNLATVASGVTPAAGTINLYTKQVDSRLYYKDSTGTEVGPLVPSAGGGTPAGLTGDVQRNSGVGTFAPSSINDNGSRVLVSENSIFRGPNLGVDVTAFGVRAVNPNAVPNTTATISAGSNQATVVSAAGFQVGDGIAIVGAGAPHTMTAPVAPTVTPSVAQGPTSLGYATPGGTGSSTYSYQLVMRDQGQGLTAASPIATVTNGATNLGANNTAVVSIASGTSNVFTATVASTANLAAGAVVIIRGTTNDSEFGGVKTVASVVDGTHFTFTSGMDASRGISTTTATGGTCYFWLSNHLTLPTPGPAGTQYLIYGNSGSMPLLGMSLVANLGFTDAQYLTWDDYGAPMTTGMTLPWWAPVSAPSAPVSDTLVTTITNISGNVLTLAAPAQTSVVGSPARFDNAPGILSAISAISTNNVPGGGGTLRFPPVVENAAGNYAYATSSYVKVQAFKVIQDATLALGDTMELATDWHGTDMSANRTTLFTNNGISFHIPILLQGANPGLMLKGGGMEKVTISMSGNGSVGLFNVGSNSSQLFSDLIIFGNGITDYTSIPFYDYHPKTTGAFGFNIRNSSFITGPGQVDGASLTPGFASKFNTLMGFDYVSGNRRCGFCISPHASGLSLRLKMGAEVQGNIVPMLTLIGEYPGNVSGFGIVEGLFTDTSWYPMVANLSLPSCTLGPDLTLIGGNTPSAGGPYISGQLFLGSLNILSSPGTQTGHNFNVINLGRKGSAAPAFLKIPGLNQTMIVYSTPHTLAANEAGVVGTGNLTFTVDCNLDGQAWDVFSQTGSTTLTAINGTLFGNGSSGSFVIPNGRGVRVVVKAGNAYALGLSPQTLTNIVTKTANYTTTASDASILCNATTGAFTITLASGVSSSGQTLRIKKVDSTGNAITINTSSGTIDGSASFVLSGLDNSVDLQFDGTNWWVF